MLDPQASGSCSSPTKDLCSDFRRAQSCKVIEQNLWYPLSFQGVVTAAQRAAGHWHCWGRKWIATVGHERCWGALSKDPRWYVWLQAWWTGNLSKSILRPNFATFGKSFFMTFQNHVKGGRRHGTHCNKSHLCAWGWKLNLKPIVNYATPSSCYQIPQAPAEPSIFHNLQQAFQSTIAS